MADSTTGVMAGVKFALLGAELNAGFLKNEQGTRIYILQDVDAANEGVTIKQLIKDVKTLLGKSDTEAVDGLSEDSIKGQLTSAGKPKEGKTFDIDSVKVVLRTVYLNIFTPATGTKTVEYAFRVDVYCEDLLPQDVQLIKVHQLSLAIWKTDNASVKKLLAIPEQASK